jgi:nucleotide-binding universal stress UspA family protein
MSVVVAYQASNIGRLTLQEAAKEASLRRTALTIIHVPEGVDIDIVEAQTNTLRDDIARALIEANLSDVEWTLKVEVGADVAETVLDLVDDVDVELLVIGARRRSPVGKMIMGSVTQTIILRADAPVLVVQSPMRK